MGAEPRPSDSAAWFVVDMALGAAATARLARLITRDSILDRPRIRFVQRMDRDGHPKLAELAVCPWCVSIWIGAVMATAIRFRVPGFRLFASALLFSQFAGVMAELREEPVD